MNNFHSTEAVRNFTKAVNNLFSFLGISEEDGPAASKDADGQPYLTLTNGGLIKEGHIISQCVFVEEAITFFMNELEKFVSGKNHVVWRIRPMIEEMNGAYHIRCRLTAKNVEMAKDKIDFGNALKMLKSGKRVCRVEWNGKGMWLALVGDWSGALSAEMPNDWNGNRSFIAVFTVDKQLVPWIASQTDMLAEDWVVL